MAVEAIKKGTIEQLTELVLHRGAKRATKILSTMRLAALMLATLALVGCGGAARARLVVTAAHMEKATITDKTKCKQTRPPSCCVTA
jgi:hypothetical protein